METVGLGFFPLSNRSYNAAEISGFKIREELDIFCIFTCIINIFQETNIFLIKIVALC